MSLSSSVWTLTYPDITRFPYFQGLYNQVRDLEGDIVECGVGKGFSWFLFAALAKAEGRGRKIWGFDSFEGFPEPSSEDQSPRNPKKGQHHFTIPEVTKFLGDSGLEPYFIGTQIRLVKGYFNESLSKYRGRGIAMLHIDCDLYESYLDVLNTLHPKVILNGIVLFAKYLMTDHLLKFPGASKAIDEFFGDKQNAIEKNLLTGKFYLVKS